MHLWRGVNWRSVPTKTENKTKEKNEEPFDSCGTIYHLHHLHLLLLCCSAVCRASCRHPNKF